MIMKKINSLIVLSLLLVTAILGVASSVSAATAGLYVSPSSKTVTAGEVINATVGINTAANKIYAIEGTLVFDQATCQNISVAAGLQALTTPTCANPHFLVGIPGGGADNKTLLTLSLKVGASSAAIVGMTGVNIVGGDSVKSISTAGGSATYTVNAKEVLQPEVEAQLLTATVVAPTTPTAGVKDAQQVKSDAGTEVTPAVTSTDVLTTENQAVGKVLGSFDEQNPEPESGNWFMANIYNIIIVILIIVIIALVGVLIFKKKKA